MRFCDEINLKEDCLLTFNIEPWLDVLYYNKKDYENTNVIINLHSSRLFFTDQCAIIIKEISKEELKIVDLIYSHTYSEIPFECDMNYSDKLNIKIKENNKLIKTINL